MIKTSIIFCFIAAISFGCSSRLLSVYEDELPAFRLENFFQGKTIGWGILLNRNNQVIKRFQVEVEGLFSENKSTGKLIENFVWSDGETETRTWLLKKVSDNKWTGKSDGVIGTAHGTIAGNALNWSYRYKILLENSFVKNLEVEFDDWMFLVEKDVLMNHAVLSKLGFKLGTVVITFKKLNE